MEKHIKSAMDQIKADQKIVGFIVNELEKENSSHNKLSTKRNYVKYTVIAASLLLVVSGGVVVTMAAIDDSYRLDEIEPTKELTQEEIKNMMVNSIDYFDSAKGEFNYTNESKGSDYTISYEISNEYGNYGSHVIATDNIDDSVEEDYYDGTNYLTLQHDKEIYYGCSTASIYAEESQPSNPVLFEEGFELDQEGDLVIKQTRQDPTEMGMASHSVFPQMTAYLYLYDNSTWEILGYEEYLGREAVVIEGISPEDYDSETFMMWVDSETGIMLKFETYDAEGVVIESLETSAITINDPSVNELPYTCEIPEGYTKVIPKGRSVINEVPNK